MNIVLTGFMGTGKSVTGRWLGRELGLEFVDTDELIELREGAKITEIFQTKGEPYFREVESAVINDLVASKNDLVVAVGGGAILNDANFENLSKWGTVIRLNANIDVIYSRVSGKKIRPLLGAGDLRENLESIINEREDSYSKVPFTVDSSYKTVDVVTDEIITYLKTLKGDT